VSRLDSPDRLRDLDPGSMLRQVADLATQLAHAGTRMPQVRVAIEALDLQRPPTELLVCGMGGSAIGGDYAAAWGASRGARVQVHRNYGLPGWVSAQTLVLFCSYSGDTEETLSAFAAVPAHVPHLCLTSGGELARRAAAAGVPVLSLAAGLQPRAALGHTLGAILWVLHCAKLLPASPQPAIEAAARQLEQLASQLGPETPAVQNRAKQLAAMAADKVIWICTGSGLLEPVGRRWKAQLNENAKVMALASALPEMHHNEIMGPDAYALGGKVQLLLLADPQDPAPIRRRLQATADLLRPVLAGVEWLEPEAPDDLARMLEITMLADYTSVYLAFLRHVDPSPVERIQELKARLRGPG